LPEAIAVGRLVGRRDVGAVLFDVLAIAAVAFLPRTPLCADMDEMQRKFMFDLSAQQLPLARLGEVTDTARAYL
jgi:hypothetical protein